MPIVKPPKPRRRYQANPAPSTAQNGQQGAYGSGQPTNNAGNISIARGPYRQDGVSTVFRSSSTPVSPVPLPAAAPGSLMGIPLAPGPSAETARLVLTGEGPRAGAGATIVDRPIAAQTRFNPQIAPGGYGEQYFQQPLGADPRLTIVNPPAGQGTAGQGSAYTPPGSLGDVSMPKSYNEYYLAAAAARNGALATLPSNTPPPLTLDSTLKPGDPGTYTRNGVTIAASYAADNGKLNAGQAKTAQELYKQTGGGAGKRWWIRTRRNVVGTVAAANAAAATNAGWVNTQGGIDFNTGP